MFNGDLAFSNRRGVLAAEIALYAPLPVKRTALLYFGQTQRAGLVVA